MMLDSAIANKWEHENKSNLLRNHGQYHTSSDEQNCLDRQIVWCANGRTNFLMNKLSDIWPFGKTIFPRRFARRDEQVDNSTT